ncbi:unnamed protein product [Cuscuta campestris]|uniref:Uncharacterized protein n=1 Tax=Cuscuta campestris TaxID=132261 RepID=A0A484LJV4_9ASTE|nr:unnamed protein product [Cuscuta campestris]
MVASKRVTRSSTANLGGGLRMTVTAPTGAGPDELDISLNDVASQNTTDLRHRIPRRRTTNAGGSQAPTQQVPTQGVGVLTQPPPNGLVCGGGMVLPGDFNSPFFQFGETSGARTPGPDPSGFWAMMRAMMLNQPMTELFAQHLKNLMTDSRLNPLAGGPENKELNRSQQRDNGKGPERRPNKKQASRRDKETVSKHREPLREGQGESESHVSVFSRMRVPVTERLYGRRNAFLQNEGGKIRMPYEEQCDQHNEVHPERKNSRVEQPVQHPILRAPQGTPIAMDGGMSRHGDERIDLLLKRLDALERRNGAGQVTEPMFRLRSPFSEMILRAPLPNSFQMPPIPRYDGTTDLQEHFNRYQTLMNVVTFSEEVLCRSFPATLDGLASEWFNELPEGKIDSWEDLARRFLVHFAGNRKKKLHFSHLLSVRQRPDEPLREFLARWKLETTRVYGTDDKTRLSTFHLVLRSGDFSKRLALEKPREYSIALAMAEDEAEAEELEANKKKEEAGRLGSTATAVKPMPRKVTIDERPHLPVGHHFRKGRDPRDRRSHGKDIYEEGGEDRRPYPPRGPKLLFPDVLTPLTHPVSAILDFAEHQGLVEYDPRFPPICTIGEGPYCRFHRAAGHDTDACKQKKRKEMGLPSDEEEEDNPRQKRVEENRMIYGGNTGGDSAEQRKKWVHSAYVGDVYSAPGPSKITKTEPLLFGPKDLPEIPSPHRDALVIRCEINEVVIHQSYVDNGSSVNIMYVRTFEELGLKKELLKRVRTPLSGFTGDIIDLEGLVEVMVTFGDGEHKRTIPVEFLVVRLLGSHNLILGRPALEDLDSVTSVKYLSMKFPTDLGVGVCRGNQKLARLCYQKQTKKMDAQDLRVDSIATALLKEEEGRPRAEPAEDTEDVVIMEEQQEKKIKLGINISAELRSRIIQVLRENFVIFAWSVEDMPRVSKSLITHRLAVEPDAEPKLNHYFQAHEVEVRSHQPLSIIIRNPTASNRVIKWSVYLSQCQIEMKPRTAIKAQASADFMVECTARDNNPMPAAEQEDWWTLSTDGSSAAKACGGGVVIQSPEGFRSYHAIKFQFKVSNNEAEYEALLSGLRLILNLKAKYVRIRCDSRLVVSQIKGEFDTKEERMRLYKEAALELLKILKGYELMQIPRAENTEADVLSKLSNDSPEHISKMAHIEDLGTPSIHVQLISVVTEEASGWIAELIRYKKDGILPGDETTARLIKRRAPTYVIENGRLYKRSYNGTLLRCVDEARAGQIMEEVHEGVCAAHQGPFSMARRIDLQGYFWPTMVKDCAKRAKRCKVCQVFQNIPGKPGTSYHPISSSIPFAHWGIDLIGLMPRAPGNFRWIIVAIDYFTKWIEAEPLDGGTSEQCSKFVNNNILCRYGVPKQITTDNRTQFEAGDFNELLEDWKIRHTYSSVAYPQGNGQVENANRTIMDEIKKRLESYKGAWVDQLPNVLWAYRTTPRRATGETPFSMCYGLEARAPSEVFIPTWREENYEAKENEEAMAADLNFVEERREQAFLKAENYRRQVKEYYDRKVRATEYRVGDLVLRKREASQPTEGEKFAKSYEGPYKVIAVLRPGTYKLSTLEGRELGRHWNTHNLISFYM